MCLYVLERSHKLKTELPETRPVPPALEVRSLNHWTAGEFPGRIFKYTYFGCGDSFVTEQEYEIEWNFKKISQKPLQRSSVTSSVFSVHDFAWSFQQLKVTALTRLSSLPHTPSPTSKVTSSNTQGHGSRGMTFRFERQLWKSCERRELVALGARSWTQPEMEVSDAPSRGRRATEAQV